MTRLVSHALLVLNVRKTRKPTELEVIGLTRSTYYVNAIRQGQKLSYSKVDTYTYITNACTQMNCIHRLTILWGK